MNAMCTGDMALKGEISFFFGVPGLSSDIYLYSVDEVGCLQQILFGAAELFCKRGSLGPVLCSCSLVEWAELQNVLGFVDMSLMGS